MNLKGLLGLCTLIIALAAAVNVSAYLDCTPSLCPSGYTDSGITCSGNKCTRDCAVNVCSGNWTQVFSDSCGWSLFDEDESECSTSSYNSSAAGYCYNFTFDGPANPNDVQMSITDPPAGHTDCDSEAIGGLFDNAKNTPTAWFENVSGYLGDVSYTSMDYLWQALRAHSETGSDEAQYDDDIVGDVDSIQCAPNVTACTQLGTGKCDVNCYNHKTFGYAYQGYVDDDGSSSNANLYRNAGCGNANGDQNKFQNANLYVYQGNLTLQHSDQICYRSNEAPTAANVIILPSSPDAGDDLFCNYTYSDPENFTELNSFYEWWKNSVNQSINSQVLGKGNLTPADVWYCKVMPSDGLANGTKAQSSNNVTISGTVKEPALYVNGSQVWSVANYYSDSETVVNFDAQLMSAMENCTADAQGYCDINLTVYSGDSSLINVSNLELYYEFPAPIPVDLNILNLSEIYSNGSYRLFEFAILNNGSVPVTSVAWSLDFGDGNVINSVQNTSLAVDEDVFVYAEHIYGFGGSFEVIANASGTAAGKVFTDGLLINVSVNGTGNFPDVNKFYVKNSSGDNIAWFGDAGNIVIKGFLEQNSTHLRGDNSAFVIRNDGKDVLIIEDNGSMYINGTLFENQDAVTTKWEDNDFRVKGEGTLVIDVNETGYVFLKGELTENANSSQLI